MQHLDQGRLQLASEFAPLFLQHGLTSCAAFESITGTVAKDLLKERTTLKFTLPDKGRGEQLFYIKRHSPPPIKEYVKPYLRFTRPILGAQNEWTAIHRFHQAGLRTMQPAALGRYGSRSFLVTAAITGCVKLSEYLLPTADDSKTGPTAGTVENLSDRIAETARVMHDAGLHHQDFYLTHLLVPQNDVLDRLYIIDLGRARWRKRLSSRWIVKDLAQLLYSTLDVPHWDDGRFLARYFETQPTSRVQRLSRRIRRKVMRIAEHSRKNQL